MRNIIAGQTLAVKRSITWGWLLATLCWAGCQKTELPPNVQEQPVFSVQGGSVASFEAGVDGNYLFTSFALDTFNILVFKGKFAGVSCTSAICPGSLQFEFRNPFEGSDVNVGEAFHLGGFEYADKSNTQSNTIYRTTFSVPDTTGFNSYLWNFGNLGTATGAVVQKDFVNSQPVRVTLTSFSNNMAVSSESHLIALAGSAVFPTVRISVQSDSNKYLIQALTTGPQVKSYAWLPDTFSQSASFVDTFLNQFYAVTVTDNFGNTASAQVDGLKIVNQPFVTPGFTSSVQTIPSGDPLQLGTVAIQWVDDQGNVWRSDRKPQLSATQFNVSASEPYELNEKGQKTQKMTVTFKCTLYSPGGEMLPFEGTGVIAVAY